MLRSSVALCAVAVLGQVALPWKPPAATGPGSASATPTASAPTASASSSGTGASKDDLSSWKHPPPLLPKGITVVPQTAPGAIKLGVVPEGGCLPGFSRVAGICVISPTLLPDLAAATFPLLKTVFPGTKTVTKATVYVEGALINASKVNGNCWDVGCDQAENAKAAKLASLAIKTALKSGGNPYAAAAAIILPIAMKGISPPDPFGDAMVIYGGASASEPTKLAKNQDTLTPSWNVVFHHVPIAQDTYLRVSLSDADLMFDDPMGNFIVSADELAKALKAGKTAKIPVNTETSEQVLFIYVSVLAEG